MGTKQPIKQHTNGGQQSKPNVAQARSAFAAPTIRKPVAPPVYRPQAKTTAVQSKMAAPSPVKSHSSAPPVYRPQPTPKVLQRKTSHLQRGAIQSEVGVKRPTAPAAYRPQPMPKVLQKKTAGVQPSQPGQPRRQPVAPPVYRPEQKKIMQPQVAATAQSRMTPTAPSRHRSQPAPNPLLKGKVAVAQRAVANVPRPQALRGQQTIQRKLVVAGTDYSALAVTYNTKAYVDILMRLLDKAVIGQDIKDRFTAARLAVKEQLTKW